METGLARSTREAVIVVASILSFNACLWAQGPDPRIKALKGEMKVLEAVIDQSLGQTFPPPFGVLEKTKGTYLPDFGLAFSLEVNLYPVRAPNPFDARPTTAEELEKARRIKLERISVIKKSIPRLLADYSSGLRDLRPDESVAVTVHLFHIQAEGETLPSQLVIEVKKQDLDLFLDKQISFDALQEKMKVLEL